ncbi:MAG: hypothetical protein PVF87_04790 [Acidimicrobiia bacterium]
MLIRLVGPIVIIAIAIVAVAVTAAGEETRTELGYLDEIRTQTTALSRSGESIGEVMPRLRQIGREEFTTVFDAAAADLDVALAFAADEPPTESLIPVWTLYRQTIMAWESGVDGLAEWILAAADDPDDSTVVNGVGDALAELRAGDSLYLDLKSQFEREEVPEPVAPLVSVTMSPSEGGLLSQSASYVAAARSATNSLGLRPGLRVSQLVADPTFQINVDGQAVIPATETVVFSAVITNTGNVTSEPETVNATLVGVDESASEIAPFAQVEVPALAPGGQTTIEFPAVSLEAETLYEVRVVLELANPDSDLTDNEVRIQFTVNAP